MDIAKKIESFHQIAIDDALSEKEQALAELENRFNDACEQYKNTVEKEAMLKLDRKNIIAHKKLMTEIMEEGVKGKKALLLRRSELLDKSVENVSKRLNDYVLTPEYQKRLIHDIDSACEKYKPLEVYLTLRDYKLLGDKIKSVPCKQSHIDFIGGFKLKINDNLIIDNTYLTKFTDAKQDMNFKI